MKKHPPAALEAVQRAVEGLDEWALVSALMAIWDRPWSSALTSDEPRLEKMIAVAHRLAGRYFIQDPEKRKRRA